MSRQDDVYEHALRQVHRAAPTELVAGSRQKMEFPLLEEEDRAEEELSRLMEEFDELGATEPHVDQPERAVS